VLSECGHRCPNRGDQDDDREEALEGRCREFALSDVCSGQATDQNCHTQRQGDIEINGPSQAVRGETGNRQNEYGGRVDGCDLARARPTEQEDQRAEKDATPDAEKAGGEPDRDPRGDRYRPQPSSGRRNRIVGAGSRFQHRGSSSRQSDGEDYEKNTLWRIDEPADKGRWNRGNQERRQQSGPEPTRNAESQQGGAGDHDIEGQRRGGHRFGVDTEERHHRQIAGAATQPHCGVRRCYQRAEWNQ